MTHSHESFAAFWESMVAMRAELDSLEFELQTQAGWDEREQLEAPPACPWCGARMSEGLPPFEHQLLFSLSEYWGPLQFDDSERNCVRVALLVGAAWRWVVLVNPDTPDGRHEVAEPVCSVECRDAFMRALRRDTATRRAQ